MTVAQDIIPLALRHAGVLGVGQAPQAADLSDGFSILSDMIDDWNLARINMGNPVQIPQFLGQTSDVAFPAGYENAIVWGLAGRCLAAWSLPPNETINALAANGYALVQSINRQQSEKAVAVGITTVLDLLQLALRMAGRSTDKQRVAKDSLDIADAFAILCMMMAQWQRKRWLVPSLAEIVIPSTGALSYPLGPNGDFSAADFSSTDFSTGVYGGVRADRIESAFARLGAGSTGTVAIPGDFAPQDFSSDFNIGSVGVTGVAPAAFAVDYPLWIIPSREDYNRISIKNLSTFPTAVFYDSAFPVANLYFWPVPPAGQFELHVFVKAALQGFSSIDDTLSAPPEYMEAMLYNLAYRLSLSFGTDVRPGVTQMASASLNTIRLANVQVPELRTHRALLGSRYGSGSGLRAFSTGGAI